MFKIYKLFRTEFELLPLDNGWQIYRILFGIKFLEKNTGPFGTNEPWITKSLAFNKMQRLIEIEK